MRACIDGRGRVQRGYDPGQRANVVLVAVGDHDGLDLVPPLGQEAGIGQDLLHAQVLEVGKHKAGVDDNVPRGGKEGGVSCDWPYRDRVDSWNSADA